MNLTKRTVESLTLPPGKTSFIFRDDTIPGLGVRLTASGRKAWVLRYSTRAGKERLYTVGNVLALTPDQARAEAQRLLGIVATGGDPLAALQAVRAIPTVKQVGEELFAWVEESRKPNTQRCYKSAWTSHIEPAFGTKRADEITEQDVARLHAKMRATPFMANFTVKVLSSAFLACQSRGILAKGRLPWADQEMYPEPRRKRRLSPAELAVVWNKLDDFPTDIQAFPSLVRAIALTGCRLSEWRDALWTWVDFDAQLLRLPDSKVGARDIPIPDEVVAILRALPRTSVYVFPGSFGGPMSAHWLWKQFRAWIGIPDIRMHDLRRTHGSVALEVGLNVREVADLLGHSSTKSTEIYLAAVKDKEASNAARVSGVIVQLATGAVTKPASDSTQKRLARKQVGS